MEGMRKLTLDRILVLTVAGVCAACGSSPAYESKTPAAVMVVPADRVVEKCPCDDADEQARPRQSVEYVPVEAWQSPPAAQRAEAFVAQDPNRFHAATPPPPALTMHRAIPETRFSRMGGYGLIWR